MIALIYIGGLISFVGGIMLLVVAFKNSVWWGLGSLFIPFVSLIFVILNWQDAKKSFFISLAGTVLMFIGFWKSPQFANAMMSTHV